jgi:uncharacterized protein involved in exopolysaccharide biosynthesis
MDTRTQNIDDSLTLKDLVRIFWRGKWVLIGLAVGLGLVAAVAAKVIPKKYSASMTISVVTDSQGGAMGSGGMASKLGDLASLVGLPGGLDTKKSESLAILQSEILTEQFVRSNDLLPVLFPKLWNAGEKHWIGADPPSLQDASGYFRGKIRTVKLDSKTALYTLTVRWYDRKLVAPWANGLVKMANDYERSQAIDQSERNIAYLTEQASKTDVAGVRAVIYAIMETEINKEMLARGTDEYAFKVIDPAVTPEFPSFPQPGLWTAAGVAFGLLLGVGILLLRSMWERSL